MSGIQSALLVLPNAFNAFKAQNWYNSNDFNNETRKNKAKPQILPVGLKNSEILSQSVPVGRKSGQSVPAHEMNSEKPCQRGAFLRNLIMLLFVFCTHTYLFTISYNCDCWLSWLSRCRVQIKRVLCGPAKLHRIKGLSVTYECAQDTWSYQVTHIACNLVRKFWAAWQGVQVYS